MDRQKEFKDFLWLPYIFAKLSGLNPAQKRPWLFKIQFMIFIAGVSNHIFIMIGEMIFVYMSMKQMTNLRDVTKIMATAAFCLNTNIKTIVVLIDSALIKAVLKTTQEIFPQSNNEKLAYRVNENFWPKSTYIISVNYFLCAWTFNFLPGAMFIYKLVRHGEEFSYEPLYNVILFDYHTKFRYSVLYISEAWATHMAACCNGGIDLLLCLCVMQMCMHFKYIAREIERYVPTGNSDDCEFLGRLIERHQLILKLCLDINRIFGLPLLFNVISSSGIICLSAFQVNTQVIGLDFVKFLFFFSSNMGLLFIVCDFGEELAFCSQNIAVSIGKNAWYYGNTSYKKMLCCFMLRCQTPVVLRAKEYVTVSLKTFKQVTGLSYRIFALLNSLPDEE